jgi:polyisoprenoid-binding protein YceI
MTETEHRHTAARPADQAAGPAEPTGLPGSEAGLPSAGLPSAGRWQIDPGHTEVAFIGRHFMLTKVRGRFTALSGTIQVADPPEDSTVEVTIDMASVQSGNRERDEHLRSPDLFDVARHPTATFTGRAAGWQGTRGTLAGQLTLHGITRPVTLQAEYLGDTADPWGGHRAIFTAAGTINREDWGLTWNLPLDGGRLLVSREIRIEIELEAVLQP